jgi:hypothetical protein
MPTARYALLRNKLRKYLTANTSTQNNQACYIQALADIIAIDKRDG